MSMEDFIKYQAETLAYLNLVHPDYALLAARVLVQDLHLNTFDSVEEYADNIYDFHEKGNRKCNLLSDETYRVFKNFSKELQQMIDYKRDYTYEVFGYKTLEKSYLLKKQGKIIERPQQLLLRVSVGIHGENMF